MYYISNELRVNYCKLISTWNPQLSEAEAEIEAYDIKIDQGRNLVADLRTTIKELREQKNNQTLG